MKEDRTGIPYQQSKTNPHNIQISFDGTDMIPDMLAETYDSLIEPLIRLFPVYQSLLSFHGRDIKMSYTPQD